MAQVHRKMSTLMERTVWCVRMSVLCKVISGFGQLPLKSQQVVCIGGINDKFILKFKWNCKESIKMMPGMVAYTFNPSPQEAEEGGFL